MLFKELNFLTIEDGSYTCASARSFSENDYSTKNTRFELCLDTPEELIWVSLSPF